MNVDASKTIDGTVDMLINSEGFRQHAYICPAGRLTIGHGINLDQGFTEEESAAIMQIRMRHKLARLSRRAPIFFELNFPRQQVLLAMAYNMGVTDLLEFVNMFDALRARDYDKAAYEMLNSKWHKDFMRWAGGDLEKTRSYRLSEVMRTGVDPNRF